MELQRAGHSLTRRIPAGEDGVPECQYGDRHGYDGYKEGQQSQLSEAAAHRLIECLLVDPDGLHERIVELTVGPVRLALLSTRAELHGRIVLA